MHSPNIPIPNQYFATVSPTSTPFPSTEDGDYNGLAAQHPFIQSLRGAAHTPSMISTSASAPDLISTSPAAMFLSAFTSSPPAPVIQDGDGDVIDGYTLGGIIGYGASSIIRTAYSASGGVVAVKIIRHTDMLKRSNPGLAAQRIQHEAAIWSSLSHEHILPLFSSLHNDHADYFFTLYCPAGSLYDILQRDGCPALPQDDAGMMFRQVVRGLRYLHEVALYVHRDIKLENVLVDEMGICRIGDFGMARKIGQLDEDDISQEPAAEISQTGHATVQRAVSLVVPGTRRPVGGIHTQLARHHHDGARHRNSTSSTHPAHSPQVFQPGSLPYASPELLLPQLSGPLLPHPAQDIWALGILLYGLLTGRLPFADSFEPRLQMKILNGTYEVPTDIGRGAERVLQGCLDRCVTTRWTIARVDEVAWGVGWGSEGDDVAVPDSDEEEYQPQTPDESPFSPARSRSRPSNITIPDSPDWQHEETRSRPSFEAASRRSSSRYKRSLSRAPVLLRTTSNKSRPSSPPPSARNGSIRSSSIVRSPSSSRISIFHDSAIIVSPPTSIERGRGRRVRKVDIHYSSRSPSPSNAPTTPSDICARSPATRQAVTSKSEGMEPSFSRGRQKNGGRVRTPLSEHQFYFPADMDVLEENTDWGNDATSGPSTGVDFASPFSMGDKQRADDHHQTVSELHFAQLEIDSSRKKRPDSLPPSSTLLWPSMHSAKGTRMFATPVHTPTFVVSTQAKAPTGRLKRSKSLEQLHSHHSPRVLL